MSTAPMKAAWIAFFALGGWAASSPAAAAMVTFNTITATNTVGRMASSYDFGTVIATAGQEGASPSIITAGKYLTVANFQYPAPDEVGVGVCGQSDTGSLCSTTISNTGSSAAQQLGLNPSIWTGDITEIDNLGSKDVLSLSVKTGSQFTGQFIIGSLDNNAGATGAGLEDGWVAYGGKQVFFTRDSTPAGAHITSGNATIAQAGAGYGLNVFLLTITDFTPAIGQVVFHSGGTSSSGANNDYLVTAAEIVPVPLPAALWLMLSGIGGLAATGRRRRTAGV
jgi:hypothetical protein